MPSAHTFTIKPKKIIIPPPTMPLKLHLKHKDRKKKTKIKLFKTRYFVEIFLYDTVKELQKATHESKNTLGLYHPEPYIIYPRLKIKPKLGTIHLAKEKLGVGYITHEVLHCIFDWWDKTHRGIALESYDDQEKACLYQGYISKEICNWLNNKKLW